MKEFPWTDYAFNPRIMFVAAGPGRLWFDGYVYSSTILGSFSYYSNSACSFLLTQSGSLCSWTCEEYMQNFWKFSRSSCWLLILLNIFRSNTSDIARDLTCSHFYIRPGGTPKFWPLIYDRNSLVGWWIWRSTNLIEWTERILDPGPTNNKLFKFKSGLTFFFKCATRRYWSLLKIFHDSL